MPGVLAFGFVHGATDRGADPKREDFGDVLTGADFDIRIDTVRWGHVVRNPSIAHAKAFGTRFSADKQKDPDAYGMAVLQANAMFPIPRPLRFFVGYERVLSVIDGAWQNGMRGTLPMIADVLLYMRHSDEILEAVRPQIEALRQREGPTILIGHSLGGVILVDALSMMEDTSGVDLLVTVGSQAPILFACDALKRIRVADENPPIFVPWLNVWDRNDLLSFPAIPTFMNYFPYTSGVSRDNYLRDWVASSNKGFPQAHSEYFDNVHTYQAILTALVELEVLDASTLHPAARVILEFPQLPGEGSSRPRRD